MKTRVISLDFDGCLFHEGYIETEDKNVIKSNSAFLNNLHDENANHYNVVMFVGSNRQSMQVDKNNSRIKGSCFPAIKNISNFLGTKLDTFLLADVYGDLRDGESFERAINNEDGTQFEHQDWRFDEEKLTILYAQIHKAAVDNPGEEIVFDFYDDRGNGRLYKTDILEKLKDFFEKYPQMIPTNVTLRLNHYAGDEITRLAEINGSGEIDVDYRRTIKKMAMITCIEDPEIGDGYDGMFHTIDHVSPRKLAIIDLYSSLEDIRVKAVELKNKSESAYNSAITLYSTIKQALSDDFEHPDYSIQDNNKIFKNKCEKAIEEARPILEKHRGWKQILGNIGLVIVGLGVGYVVAGSIHKIKTGKFLFFNTDSSSKLNKVEESIEKTQLTARQSQSFYHCWYFIIMPGGG